MSENTQKEKSIGALWIKEGRQGQFLSGVLENADGVKVSIVAFPNSFKTEQRHPDYKIFRARDQGASSQESNPQSAAVSDNTPPPHTDADEPIQVNDVPF